MNEFHAFRRSAIRYWERRRIIYNIVLVPPAFIGYALSTLVIYVGDPHAPHYSYILPLFAVSALGANICYSSAYALEFLFASDESSSRWLGFGRTTTFVVGLLFAVLLSFLGGRNIAELEFYDVYRRLPGDAP
jgi:hypothetical protein